MSIRVELSTFLKTTRVSEISIEAAALKNVDIMCSL